jgi:hypothetical protein
MPASTDPQPSIIHDECCVPLSGLCVFPGHVCASRGVVCPSRRRRIQCQNLLKAESHSRTCVSIAMAGYARKRAACLAQGGVCFSGLCVLRATIRRCLCTVSRCAHKQHYIYHKSYYINRGVRHKKPASSKEPHAAGE